AAVMNVLMCFIAEGGQPVGDGGVGDFAVVVRVHHVEQGTLPAVSPGQVLPSAARQGQSGGSPVRPGRLPPGAAVPVPPVGGDEVADAVEPRTGSFDEGRDHDEVHRVFHGGQVLRELVRRGCREYVEGL